MQCGTGSGVTDLVEYGLRYGVSVAFRIVNRPDEFVVRVRTKDKISTSWWSRNFPLGFSRRKALDAAATVVLSRLEYQLQ
jgi:hypothetical protein